MNKVTLIKCLRGDHDQSIDVTKLESLKHLATKQHIPFQEEVLPLTTKTLFLLTVNDTPRNCSIDEATELLNQSNNTSTADKSFLSSITSYLLGNYPHVPPSSNYQEFTVNTYNLYYLRKVVYLRFDFENGQFYQLVGVEVHDQHAFSDFLKLENDAKSRYLILSWRSSPPSSKTQIEYYYANSDDDFTSICNILKSLLHSSSPSPSPSSLLLIPDCGNNNNNISSFHNEGTKIEGGEVMPLPSDDDQPLDDSSTQLILQQSLNPFPPSSHHCNDGSNSQSSSSTTTITATSTTFDHHPHTPATTNDDDDDDKYDNKNEGDDNDDDVKVEEDNNYGNENNDDNNDGNEEEDWETGEDNNSMSNSSCFKTARTSFSPLRFIGAEQQTLPSPPLPSKHDDDDDDWETADSGNSCGGGGSNNHHHYYTPSPIRFVGANDNQHIENEEEKENEVSGENSDESNGGTSNIEVLNHLLSKVDKQHKLQELQEMFVIPFTSIKIIRVVANGAFGIVYEVEWNGTRVAYKTLLSSSPSVKERTEFTKEMLLMRSLRHPNIVQFLGVVLTPNLGIITDFFPKGSLHSVLHSFRNKKSALHFGLKLRISSDIAKGMKYLHSKNILHRDLKSANILMGDDYRAHITDFGLSKVLEIGGVTTTRCGTDGWMAPEVVLSVDYGEAADVYSYGVVLLEIFSDKAMSEYYDEKGRFQPQIDFPCYPKLADLIEQCWSVRANERPNFLTIIDQLTLITEEYDQHCADLNDAESLSSSSSSSDLPLTFKSVVEGDITSEEVAELENNVNENAAPEIILSILSTASLPFNRSNPESLKLWSQFSSILLRHFIHCMSQCHSADNNNNNNIRGSGSGDDYAALQKLMIQTFKIGYVDVEEEGKRIIHYCSIHGDDVLLNIVLQFKDEIECNLFAIDVNHNCFTALHYAVINNAYTCCVLLLKAGLAVDQRDESGNTPLVHAVIHSHVEVVNLLLHYEADPNMKTSHLSDEKSILCLAAKRVTQCDTNLDPFYYITCKLLCYGAQLPLHLNDPLPYLSIIISAAKHVSQTNSSISFLIRSYLNYIISLDQSYSPPSIQSIRSDFLSASPLSSSPSSHLPLTLSGDIMATATFEALPVKNSIISIRTHLRSYICCKEVGGDRSMSIQFSSQLDNDVTWTLEPTSTRNVIKIRSFFSELVLSAASDESGVVSLSEKSEDDATNWKLVETESKNRNDFFIRSHFGTYLSVSDNHGLCLVSHSPKEKETFHFQTIM